MKKSGFRKSILLVSALAMSTSLAACSKTNGNSAEKATGAAAATAAATAAPSNAQGKSELKEAELVWYYPQNEIPKDLKTVQDEVNKITKQKINATVKLVPVAFGDYPQKMNTVVASGEVFDIAWTSTWSFDYLQNVSKGAFIPLDDMLAKTTPKLKSVIPDYAINAAKVNGKLYGIPSIQYAYYTDGFYFQKRLVDKYNIDLTGINKLEDLEPVLSKIKQGEPDLIPLPATRAGLLQYFYTANNLEPVHLAAGIFIDYNDPKKIVSLYSTAQYKKTLDTLRSYYQKGYINQEAPTLKSITDIRKAGKEAIMTTDVMKEGKEQEVKRSNGDLDVVKREVSKPRVMASAVTATINAISRTSKNPERALMLLELMNTDKNLFNLISFGVENKHYTKIGDNTVKIILDGGYNPNTSWVFGNVFNGYLLEGQAPDTWTKTEKLNNESEKSPIMDFKFDATSVSSEIANIVSVIDEYKPGLETGAVDIDKVLPQFQDKLKNAGSDKVVAEAQKQLDAYYSAKK
ncbi:ABC transporter substrate-binding protein [Paenibacillus cymbidii]|uniref:ABC transporter substrate-binding protein n=1 Tax=Paenibacillus cymbidii TaxID=1639034 RepID=UPI0010818305|nr:ABC transporter substrate-binding protein [Paenibacillus cymbidii]